LLAQPPDEIEPAVTVLKSEMQAGLSDIAIQVAEPLRPSLLKLLF
jgi:hypothetical protein